MKKVIYIIFIVVLLALIGGGIYYWFFYSKIPITTVDDTTNATKSGFSPFTGQNIIDQNDKNSTITQNIQNTDTSPTSSEYKLPKLRQLSTTPVAGYIASSTASSSIARFIDRGTGHIYEASNISPDIVKISNTTLPKIYEAYGNKNGTNFILRYLKNDTDIISNFYAELRKIGTSSNDIPYELKGKFLSPDINQVVVSPSGDKVFTWNIESGNGIGYISSFDEKTKVKTIDIPLNQVSIDWPETNSLIISTKASAVSSSFIYSIDPKTGISKTILGGLRGLTGKVNLNNSKLIYSVSDNNSLITSIMDLKGGGSEEVIFRTLPEKCVWSNTRKEEVFCAVPTEISNALYPDDWYKGKVSFIDQIWHLNTTTGEVHLLANLIKISNKTIDAIDLKLDPKENTLYFINKQDLTLWALDLNQ